MTVLDRGSDGDVGQYSSLALDSSGHPVIAYWDSTEWDLMIAHCDDPNCIGGGESVTSPDIAGYIGGGAISLVLDASGFPVVSYVDGNSLDLKVLHCNDPNCSGGGESITSPDTYAVGQYSSLALDDDGFPVVSYYDYLNVRLMILHCNDPNCAGGNESITSPDEGGEGTSLVLDDDGFPVVSYSETLLHCNDPDCTGGDESISFTGVSGSLALDGDGFPVVSGSGALLHCNDPDCDSTVNGPESTSPVAVSGSLVLDDFGFPVVADSNSVLHCNGPDCTGGDESIWVTDPDGGGYPSLALDDDGFPVVSYYDATNGDLKLLHCNDPDCAGDDDSIATVDSGVQSGDVGRYSSVVLDSAGFPVISYYDDTDHDLKVLHCNDANCSGGDESITAPDTAGDVGAFTSLALDDDGNPVVSYCAVVVNFPRETCIDLKVLHCNDPDCSGGGESITSPDTTVGYLGASTSLVLDDGGNPVVSYCGITYSYPAGKCTDLKIMHCNDPNCAGDDENITSPDTAGDVALIPPSS